MGSASGKDRGLQAEHEGLALGNIPGEARPDSEEAIRSLDGQDPFDQEVEVIPNIGRLAQGVHIRVTGREGVLVTE